MTFWALLFAVICGGLNSLAWASPEKEIRFDLDSQCALSLLQTTLARQSSKTNVYVERDGSYLVTLTHYSLSFQIPVRRFTPLSEGGYQVTYFYDEPGPEWVARLPYFSKITELEPEEAMAVILEEDSEVESRWKAALEAFDVAYAEIDRAIDEARERLVVTDHLDPDDLGRHIALALAPRAPEILRKGLFSSPSFSAAQICEQAREHLFSDEFFKATRDLDNLDETYFVMLRDSLVVMRNNRFQEEADRRASELLNAIGCDMAP